MLIGCALEAGACRDLWLRHNKLPLKDFIAARLQTAFAKVVELLVPHQSQGVMLVPYPLEPRGRPDVAKRYGASGLPFSQIALIRHP
ncbi:hypothetical protein JYB87_11350 [Shewanella avicenniae]|uniref:Uncharacterized protein n=1 Tax=Shewanella avicenniae TaxID=2814294 RepID=A0ABX7QNR7_9GAMM|nr:hypothetical protein [Shewanella avicenniae]QSX32363.1 hypothetical protein JYB87_11350 [Shewanella avicenniae]